MGSDDDEDDDDSSTTHTPMPEPPGPRRSTRNPGPSIEERVRQAVQESTESGNRIRQTRAQNRANRADEHIPNENDAHSLIDGIVMSMLSSDVGINLEYPDDPKSLKEALESDEADHWLEGIHEELDSIRDMNVYDLVPRTQVPRDRKVMSGKFHFKRKRDANGRVCRHKVRRVLRGYEMIYGKDYTKSTSPTARMESERIVCHIAAALDWQLYQIDVKTAYLYGDLDEEIYMDQPKGFEEPGKEDWVWRLKKGLYGMKQGGRIWNKTMDVHMKDMGFTQISVEHCLYMRTTNAGTTIAAVHVDDFTVTSSTCEEERQFEEEMRKHWKITKSDASFIVGISIKRNRADRTIALSQVALIDRILVEFNCKDVNPTITPLAPGTKLSKRDSPRTEEEKQEAAKLPYQQLVGSLMYLAIATRPDIMHAVSTLSRFNSCFGVAHWRAAIHIVAYLKGTRDYCLILGGGKPVRLVGYTDSDYANCPDSRKSVSGYCFTLGSGIISWMSKKQATVATSSTEAEYMAAAAATKEAVWLRNLLSEIQHEQARPTPIFIDNNGARILTEDPSFHQRAKHIEVQHHYSRECAQRGIVHFEDVASKDNLADIFTKSLGTAPFEKLRSMMGMAKVDTDRP
ncbi:unnamed protein product [Peniophora sp. CBMAI 1063]|nr:unnamed protein product [Peniophora sp. CBMAI 1063]